MKIGENIRNARRRQDLTQEQLAEYLNLSVSAVSQWENGKTMPDIALLPALTQMLGVSADELLGIDAEHTKQAVDAYESESARLWRQGDVAGALRLWREAAQRYPKDYNCLRNLADAHAAYAVLRLRLPLRMRTTPRNAPRCASASCATAPTLKSAVRSYRQRYISTQTRMRRSQTSRRPPPMPLCSRRSTIRGSC